MLYELTLSYQGGSFHAVLKDVSIVNGCVYGTQVGILDGFDENGELRFATCEPLYYIAGGNAFNLVEYKGELKKKA